ncbi:SdpI family protein [Spongiimicrobium salis]|uniref:SdpI family protein n=1 Tax=Spongiimicrobium salis TaxID=1667022 RepID=UPI00374D1F97
MRKKLLREIPLWVLIILPILYLIKSWNQIPEKIPVHFNLYGEADRWGGKNTLYFIAILVPLLTYGLFLLAKYIDPKKKLGSIGNKLYHIRVFLSMIIASVVLLYIHILIHPQSNFQSSFYIIIGFTIFILGNYFRNIKPNYFIGFRTPWALENESIWRSTHHYGSIVWCIGGLLIIILNLWKSPQEIWIINAGIVAVLILVPIIYSYHKYYQLSKKA